MLLKGMQCIHSYKKNPKQAWAELCQAHAKFGMLGLLSPGWINLTVLNLEVKSLLDCFCLHALHLDQKDKDNQGNGTW